MAELPIWAVIGLPFSGYLAAVATEYLRGRQTLTRERETRQEARAAAREDARDAFERETLIELQDAMAVLMRNAARTHHETEMEYRQSGTWGRRALPEEIGGEPAIALVHDFQRLRVRVLDGELRALCQEWWSAASQSTIPALREEDDESARTRASAVWKRCTALYPQVMEAIGSRLRELVAGWDSRSECASS